MLSSKNEDLGQLQLKDEFDAVEDDDCFESVDKLISHGISAGDVKKLRDAGIKTCYGLMKHMKSTKGIKGLSDAKVDKICKIADKVVGMRLVPGSDLKKKIQRKFQESLFLLLQNDSASLLRNIMEKWKHVGLSSSEMEGNLFDQNKIFVESCEGLFFQACKMEEQLASEIEKCKAEMKEIWTSMGKDFCL